MKAAPFEYQKAATLPQALAALANGGEEAMIIAGGQTLLPMMAMRFARPALLIDIHGLMDLQVIEDIGEVVRIGGTTRQADCLASPIIAERVPLLAKALPFIGHQQTRNRGTVGGSVAHGDPAAEIPLIAVALDAEILLRKQSGERSVASGRFYDGPMSSIREPDECLTEIRFPVWTKHGGGGGRVGCDFEEVSERRGDFAVVAAAVQLKLDQDGACERAAVAVGGAAGTPVRASAAETALIGQRLDDQTIAAAAAAIDDAIDPADDSHASAGYRRRVARKLVARTIAGAATDALGATA